jgi:hypothetical protein
MSASLIIFIIIHILVFAFFVESLRRTAIRAREYPMEESPETLPFGFIRLRHVVIFYILIYIAWIILSLWLYSVFIGDIFIIKGIRTPSNAVLDL